MEDIDREYYQGLVAELRAEVRRLRAAIIRIDAINDNPACFSKEINDLCDPILRPHLKAANENIPSYDDEDYGYEQPVCPIYPGCQPNKCSRCWEANAT